MTVRIVVIARLSEEAISFFLLKDEIVTPPLWESRNDKRVEIATTAFGLVMTICPLIAKAGPFCHCWYG
jgi:hypothetical protein